MLREQTLDSVPRFLIDNRIVKASMNLTLVGQPTHIDRIRQDFVQMASADEAAASGLARPVRPHGQPHILSVEDGLQSHHAADVKIASEELPHEVGVLLDDVERPILDSIAKRDDASHPDALLL